MDAVVACVADERGGPITMQRFVERTGLSESAARRAISRAVARGYVEREYVAGAASRYRLAKGTPTPTLDAGLS